MTNLSSIGQPTWGPLSEKCPKISADACLCDGIQIVGRKQAEAIGRFVREEGYRGVFPWASNYDVLGMSNSSIISNLARGLGIA